MLRTASILLLLTSGELVVNASDNIGYFWHVTDFHYDPWYGKGLMGNKEYFLGDYDQGCWTETRGKFGDFNCDAPDTLIKSAVEFIRDFNGDKFGLETSDIQLIIWTGDDTAHTDNSFYNETLVLESIQFIIEQLKGTGKYILPVLGNHDIHEKNQMPVDGRYYKEFAKLLRTLPGLDNTTILKDIENNDGFFSVNPGNNFILEKVQLNLRLIGLNSNLWYKSNLLVENLDDPAGQFGKLERELTEAREVGERVLIFSHIPPGVFERFYQKMDDSDNYGFHWMSEKYNDRYLDLVAAYHDVIELQLFAHHHTDSFKIFRTADTAPVSVGLIAPGLTPWNSTLAPETGANNPGLRLFKFDKTTGQVLDYHQFYLDLNKANTLSTAEWELEYSLLEYFKLSDLSVDSIDGLVSQLPSNRDQFNSYYAVNTVLFESAQDSDANCSETCRRYHWCAMSQLRYGDFDACVTGGSAINALHSVLYLVIAYLYKCIF